MEAISFFGQQVPVTDAPNKKDTSVQPDGGEAPLAEGVSGVEPAARPKSF